jgi:hypothetical protein
VLAGRAAGEVGDAGGADEDGGPREDLELRGSLVRGRWWLGLA